MLYDGGIGFLGSEKSMCVMSAQATGGAFPKCNIPLEKLYLPPLEKGILSAWYQSHYI